MDVSVRAMKEEMAEAAAIQGGIEHVMEPQIEAITVKEMSDLVAQGENVSYVLVSDEGNALEWIQGSEIVLKSEDFPGHPATEQVIIVKTASSEELTAAESSLGEGRTGESAGQSDLAHQSKKRRGSDQIQLTPKMIKLSNEETTVKVEVTPNVTVAETGESETVKVLKSSDKAADINSSLSNKTAVKSIPTPESHTVKATQGKDSYPTITIYASSGSPNSSLTGSSATDNLPQHLPSDGKVTVHHITSPSSEPDVGVTASSESVHISPTISTDIDYQVIEISTPGAHVEIPASSDSPQSSRATTKELQESGGTVLNTGIVDGSFTYKCAECDYASSNKHYYKQHVDLVHNTARPFKCPFCDYAGKRGHALREHLIVHSAQRPYSCLHCNATFRKKGHLTNHTKLHAASSSNPAGIMGHVPRETTHFVKMTSAAEGNCGNVVKVPVSTGVNSPSISVSAEPSGELTVIPPKPRSQPGVTSLPKRSPLWCALCDEEMRDAGSFQAHLKVVHGTDRLFACDRCEFVTASKGAIMNHLAVHIYTTNGAENLQPTPAAAAVTLPTGSRPATSTPPSCSSSMTKTHAAVSAGGASVIASGTAMTSTLASATASPVVAASPVAMAASRSLPVSAAVGKVAVPGSMAAVPSVTAPAAATPLYVCAQCNFSSPKMSVFMSHAASHSPAAGAGVAPAATAAAKMLVQVPVKQQALMSKVICSECGHVADNADMMRAHLWTHIGSVPSAELPDKVPAQGEEKLVSFTMSPSPADQTSTTGPAALKALPENAAFKCTECSYVSRDASQFVKHMLVHKTQHNQAPRAQVQPVESVSSSSETPQSSTTGSRSKSSYKVKPITTENTCQNTESSPFVHDASTGRFRCTICGYSCEYQRTIKAHIWKHSGHHQVDYPIFQNGPLSMYEYPVNGSQPTVPQGQASTAVTNSRSEPTHPVQPKSETTCTNTPAATLPVVKAASTKPSSGSGAAPVSVKFITVSGSQILCSSNPLPPGNLKLIPVPPAPVTKSSSSAEKGSRPVVMHVQSPQTEAAGKSSSGVSAEKKDEVCAVVKADPEKKEPTVMDSAGKDQAALCRGPVSKAVGSMAFRTQIHVLPVSQASIKAEVQPGTSTGAGGTAAAVKASPVTVVCTSTAASKVTVSVKTVASTASAKHVLPQSAAADVHRKAVAVPAQAQSEKPVQVLQVLSEPTKVIAISTVQTPTPNSEQQDKIPAPGEGLSHSHGSASTTVDQISSTGKAVESISPAAKAQDTSVAEQESETLSAGVEKSTSSIELPCSQAQLSTMSPNVVVETVATVSSHSSLTGLSSQQKPSSVPLLTSTHQVASSLKEPKIATHLPVKTESQEVEACTPAPAQMTEDVEKAATVSDGQTDSAAKSRCAETDESPDTDTKQDSESAVTLLSLLKRGPNFNPAYPPSPSKCRHIEMSLQDDLSQDSPNRSPTSSSEPESIPRDSTTDAMSEDLAAEMEPLSSGKTRGGGGGICSTLLAVIEQLRERSRSESDAEDKQTQAPSKKRPGRRRGRQESQEESLESVDSDNIEQLSGEYGVTYRCKLCHYSTGRISHIRLHMRTHRQKDPFECSLCPMVAESSEALQEHMIQHCKIRTYTCKFCSKTFSHKSTLRAHMRAHNDSEPFMCALCDFVCSSPLDYRAHMQKHAGNALLCCPRCPALVASRQDLTLHQADNCPATLPSPRTCRDGEKTDEGSSEDTAFQEKILCPKSGFTATDQASMEDHMAGHAAVSEVGMGVAGEGPHSCALCNFTAVSSRSLKSHMKRHTNDQRYVQQPLEQYKCSLCGYICHHLPSLKSHLWRHASDQNYSYQFTNDVINAAIDYDTRSDPSPQAAKTTAVVAKEADEPELLDKVLSAERKIVEGQMSRAGDSQPICWVTFRCCQCGFETINKAKLNLHMRTHADIINRTLKVSPGSVADGENVPVAASAADSDNVNVQVVYGPV